MKRYGRFICVLLAAFMLLSLAACKKEPEPENGEFAVKDEALLGGKPTEGANRVFYEIFVGSFSDSDGDGIGDIRGIINRMDYLNDGDPDSGRSLGVEGLWLTPIFKSPSYHKYDVTDYYQVDPAFGTEEDLKELITLCHERGVYVILDLPINHTGKMNDWYNQFVIAQRAGDYESQYYNFYTWFDGAQGQPPAGRTFEKIAGTDHYYECNFSGDMPELNFDSSYVRETVFDIAKYYLDLGVDGFRFDAAKYVYFGDHAKSLEFWKEYMGRLREVKPDIYCVAEVWDGDGITDIYYEAVDCFNFTMSQAEGYIGAAAMKGDVNRYTSYVEGYINKISSLREGAVMMPFISNHDMDRAAGYLTVASYAMQMAANIYILGPGSPFIYYGEELGMRGSRGAANTDSNRRLAMPWGDGDTVKDPAGTSYPDDKRLSYTAADEIISETSLYTYYKKLIMARKANPEIGSGEYKALRLSDTKVGGFISTLDGSSVMVLHNTTLSKQTIDLSALTQLEISGLAGVFGAEDAQLDGTSLTLGSQTSVIIRLG